MLISQMQTVGTTRQ